MCGTVYCVDATDFSPKESCFLIKHYFYTLSFDTVYELFNEKFGNQWLHNTMVKCVVDHFHTHHIISCSKGSGGRVTTHTVANWEDVRQRITHNLRLSVRKLGGATVQMSRASVHCTLCDLKLHLYRFPVWHELKLAKNSIGCSTASFVIGLTRWITVFILAKTGCIWTGISTRRIIVCGLVKTLIIICGLVKTLTHLLKRDYTCKK